MDTWIERTCRARCIVQSVLLGVAAAHVLWLTEATFGVFKDHFRGPHPVEARALIRATMPDGLPHRFVEVDCTGAVDTGIVRYKGSDKSAYWAVTLGDRFLLVKAEARPSGCIEGELRRLDPKLSHLLRDADRQAVLPLVLEQGDPRIFGAVMLLILAGVAAVSTACFVRSFRRAIEPARHPAVRRFAPADQLARESQALEADLAGHDVVKFRGWRFTRRFAIDRRLARFDVRRWTDLVWAYKVVTKHRINFFIPAGTTYDPVFCFSDGSRIQLEGRWTFGGSAAESTVDELLSKVAARAPWAVIGFSDSVEASWRRERAGLTASVAARRAAIVDEAPEAA
jgi:hypothetical protein